MVLIDMLRLGCNDGYSELSHVINEMIQDAASTIKPKKSG
jgi:hypothetical protein